MYKKISSYQFDCNVCPTPCDGISKGVYNFKNDVNFAETQEQIIIDHLNRKGYQAAKCNREGFPDIIIKKHDKISSYLEVKAQRRTFMQIKKILPQTKLLPSETLALNKSDLLRYFEIFDREQQNIFIVWVLQNRPCIVPQNQSYYYYQNLSVLRKIYENCGNKRTFKRKSGQGDIVNGAHKGVVVNYHFSLNELIKWNLSLPDK